MFDIGQKVICISQCVGGYPVDEKPIIGCVYTIRDIDIRIDRHIYPIGLRFEEIKNEPHIFIGSISPSETSFRATRFRPLIEDKITYKTTKEAIE